MGHREIFEHQSSLVLKSYIIVLIVFIINKIIFLIFSTNLIIIYSAVNDLGSGATP